MNRLIKIVQNIILLFLVLVPFRVYSDPELIRDTHMPNRGIFAGQELDLSSRRSITILDATESAKYNPSPGEVVIANFYHEGKFWIAKIPANAVDEIYWMRAKGPTPPISIGSKTITLPNGAFISHSLLRFTFKPGKNVSLYPQEGTEAPQKAEFNELIHAVDNLPTKADPGLQAIERGFFNNFSTAYRFQSPNDTYFEWVYVAKADVEQIPLSYTDAEKSQKLLQALQTSHEVGHKNMFNTIGLNCTTELFDLLDKPRRSFFQRMISAAFRRSSYTPKFYLWLRGLIPFSTLVKNQTPTFNEVTAPLKLNEDPSFRKRTRQMIAAIRPQRDAWEQNKAKYEAKTQLCNAISAKLGGLFGKRKPASIGVSE